MQFYMSHIKKVRVTGNGYTFKTIFAKRLKSRLIYVVKKDSLF